MARLIDAYEMCERVHAVFLLHGATLKNMLKAVDRCHTIDAAPVRHGRWVEDDVTYPGPGLANNICSVCGLMAGAWYAGLPVSKKWRYCPNCGAKMDGGENDDTND